MKEEDKIEKLAEEIADELKINSDMVNLSQVVGGYFADIYTNSHKLEGNVCKTPLSAMKSLLNKTKLKK